VPSKKVIGPTVSITGVTGFIGAAVARKLAGQGWRVRALVRPGSEKKLPADLTYEVFSGTLDDISALEQLVSGSDAVVHCAGLVRGLTQAEFDAVNVAGVERLAQVTAACARSPKVIFFSSLAAREPLLSPYALSKQRGEAVLMDNNNFSWVILRPPAVYGPGDRELLPLLKFFASGFAPVLGPTEARFSLLYVEDLADAVSTLLHEFPEGEVLELDDGREGGYDWQEVIDIARRVRGKPIVSVPVPGWLLHSVALLSAGSARVLGYPPMLTRGKVNELRHRNWVCDTAKINRLLTWSPQVQFEQGFRLALAN